MLAVPPERLLEGLGLLDPAPRALLELSLRREVADPALAELLNSDVDTVVRQRADALDRLADVLDATPVEVEEALIGHWRGEAGAEPTAEEPAPEDEEPAPAEEEAPPAEPPEEEAPPAEPPERSEPWSPGDAVRPGESERPRRRGLWAAVTALAAIGLILLLALSGGDDDEPTGPGADTTPATETSPPPPPPDDGAEPVELQPVLAGGEAGGTARIADGPRLELRLRGLGEGEYGVWLYNSIGDARRLASARGPAPFVRARLPEGSEGFRYVDVSREPDDGNPNHSGASVLRVPTGDLPGG